MREGVWFRGIGISIKFVLEFKKWYKIVYFLGIGFEFCEVGVDVIRYLVFKVK